MFNAYYINSSSYPTSSQLLWLVLSQCVQRRENVTFPGKIQHQKLQGLRWVHIKYSDRHSSNRINVTLDICGNPIESQWSSTGNIQGNLTPLHIPPGDIFGAQRWWRYIHLSEDGLRDRDALLQTQTVFLMHVACVVHGIMTQFNYRTLPV